MDAYQNGRYAGSLLTDPRIHFYTPPFTEHVMAATATEAMESVREDMGYYNDQENRGSYYGR
jgi:hypothetical protein